MQWIDALYEETKQQWQAADSADSKYAIFYSPVVLHPSIALIGYNPGGDGRAISVDDIKVPEVHEYATADYRIAVNMRRVFNAAGLDIKDTVKFNLIFFRSKSAAKLKSVADHKKLIHFSEQKVLDILDRLKPQTIIAEGFATFERLLHLTGGTQTETVAFNNRTILLVGKTAAGTPLFGMLHPTGAFGISHALLDEIGRQLGQRINTNAD